MVDKCLLHYGVIPSIDVSTCLLTQTSCAADFNSIWMCCVIRNHLCSHNEKSLMNGI